MIFKANAIYNKGFAITYYSSAIQMRPFAVGQSTEVNNQPNTLHTEIEMVLFFFCLLSTDVNETDYRSLDSHQVTFTYEWKKKKIAAHAFVCPCEKSAHISTSIHLRHDINRLWANMTSFLFSVVVLMNK